MHTHTHESSKVVYTHESKVVHTHESSKVVYTHESKVVHTHESSKVVHTAIRRGFIQVYANTSCSKTEIQETSGMGYRGTGIPCAKCVSHTEFLAHGNNKGESRGKKQTLE